MLAFLENLRTSRLLQECEHTSSEEDLSKTKLILILLFIPEGLSKDCMDMCHAILRKALGDEKQDKYQLGLTKIFFRAGMLE
jgi:myosin heavy subunit